MVAKFACIPLKYAPKRKTIDFALPQWRNKLGDFDDPDIASWVNGLYQDKIYKTPAEFNAAYDQAISMGVAPSEMVGWCNKTMVLTKEDVANFEEEFNEGAFDAVKPGVVAKMLVKMKAALETGEKVIFVY
jgi:hypothetical protein